MTHRPAEGDPFAPERARRGILLDGCSIAALALGLRVLYVVYASHADPFFAWSRKGFDQYVYQTQAAQILDGDWWLSQQPVFFHSPLYSYFLASLFGLFGRGGFLAVHLTQALLGALAVSLAYLTARTWLARWASWMVAALLALAAPWLYYEQALLQEGLLLFFYAALLWGLRTGQLGLLAHDGERLGPRRAVPLAVDAPGARGRRHRAGRDRPRQRDDRDGGDGGLAADQPAPARTMAFAAPVGLGCRRRIPARRAGSARRVGSAQSFRHP